MHSKYAFSLISKYIFLLLACCIFLTSCNKKVVPPTPQPYVYGKVTIGNADYFTVTIGNQIWTTADYHGLGAFQYPAAGLPPGGSYPQEVALDDVVLPAGWRVPTVADFNTFTANISTATDANGNYTAGAEVSKLYSVYHFVNNPTGYFYYSLGETDIYDTTSSYFLTSDKNFPDSNGYNMYAYRLNSAGASIVLLSKTGYVALASIRFVRNL